MVYYCVAACANLVDCYLPWVDEMALMIAGILTDFRGCVTLTLSYGLYPPSTVDSFVSLSSEVAAFVLGICTRESTGNVTCSALLTKKNSKNQI